MLRLSYYTWFPRQRRALTIRVDPEYPIDKPDWRTRGFEIRLHPHPEDQRLVFQWSGHWQYKEPYKLKRAMGVIIDVQYDPVPELGGRWAVGVFTQNHDSPHGSPYAGWSHWPASDLSWKLPNADWGALLQVGRAVAAGKAEPLNVMGWIEDNLPEPWNLFASPDPVEAFRALSPLPLYEE